ncbi:hypothetical protein GQ457_06G017670 [Hibiscus cannabinus]
MVSFARLIGFWVSATLYKSRDDGGSPNANVCSLDATSLVSGGNSDSSSPKSVSNGMNSSSCSQCLHVSTAGSSGQWFIDTGATHHVTPEASNVHHGSDFSSPGKLVVGDGKGLVISRIGSTVLNSSSRELYLRNLLLVPNITKNLLSVSKFAKDNGVYFEFHADRCVVRDNGSGDVLLHRVETDGLYSFNSNFASANNTEVCLHELSSAGGVKVQPSLTKSATLDVPVISARSKQNSFSALPSQDDVVSDQAVSAGTTSPVLSSVTDDRVSNGDSPAIGDGNIVSEAQDHLHAEEAAEASPDVANTLDVSQENHRVHSTVSGSDSRGLSNEQCLPLIDTGVSSAVSDSVPLSFGDNSVPLNSIGDSSGFSVIASCSPPSAIDFQLIVSTPFISGHFVAPPYSCVHRSRCYRFTDKLYSDVIEEFNKLQQKSTVEDYQERFEALQPFML